MNNAYITSVVEKKVATITFFHPQSNSMPGDLLQELAQKIEAAGNDSQVKVILLKSGGNAAFCAGASFDELLSINDEEAGRAFFLGFARVINAVRKAPKFVIVRVQGKCVGGGVGIVAAADYAIAIASASIKLSELAIGIGPFVIGPAVQRKIGVSAFSQLTINATQWKEANWALQKGLYMDVCSSPEELEETVNQLVHKLAESSSDTMKELKEMFWEGTENWEDLLLQRAEVVAKLSLSDFSKEIIKKIKKA